MFSVDFTNVSAGPLLFTTLHDGVYSVNGIGPLSAHYMSLEKFDPATSTWSLVIVVGGPGRVAFETVNLTAGDYRITFSPGQAFPVSVWVSGVPFHPQDYTFIQVATVANPPPFYLEGGQYSVDVAVGTPPGSDTGGFNLLTAHFAGNTGTSVIGGPKSGVAHFITDLDLPEGNYKFQNLTVGKAYQIVLNKT